MYCIASMLLIRNLASLYDQLSKSDVMMRWSGWESCTYPIHSGMSRVFHLPQHRTLSTRHPLALCGMWLTGCWVCVDERLDWKSLGSPSWVWTPGARGAKEFSKIDFYKQKLSSLSIDVKLEGALYSLFYVEASKPLFGLADSCLNTL